MKNRYINKDTFFNIDKGIGKKFIFLLPTIVIGTKKMIRWELETKSITISFLKFYFQINIFNVIKDSSKEIFKQDIVKVLNILKKHNLNINSIANLITYLQENNFLLTIIKNVNQENIYSEKIILYYFQNCPYIVKE